MFLKNKIILIFFFTFIFYLIVFCYTLNNYQIALIGDAKEYIKEAENITKYHTVYCGNFAEKIKPVLYSRRPPLYPFFIAIFILIFKNYYLILFFQILLTIFTGYLILKILDLQYTSHRWKIIVVICFLFYPSQIIFTNIIMSEILLQTFLVSSFYFFIKYSSEKKINYLLLYNLCLVGAVLTKPVMSYFWIPNVLIHLWLFFKDKKMIILAFPAILIITVSLWSYRNYRLTGVFHFSSIRNHNLLEYNIRGFLSRKLGSPQANEIITSIENKASEKSTYKEKNHYIEKESLKIIQNNPVEYSFYHIRGILNFFIDPGRFDIYNFFQIEKSKSFWKLFNQYGYKGLFQIFKEIPWAIILYLMIMLTINTLFLGSFFYFFFRPYDDKAYKIFIVLIFLYVAFFTGPIGASRFRLPVYPFILLTLPKIIKDSKVLNSK